MYSGKDCTCTVYTVIQTTKCIDEYFVGTSFYLDICNINLRMVFYKLPSPPFRQDKLLSNFLRPLPRQTHLFSPVSPRLTLGSRIPSLTANQRTVSVSFTWSADFSYYYFCPRWNLQRINQNELSSKLPRFLVLYYIYFR